MPKQVNPQKKFSSQRRQRQRVVDGVDDTQTVDKPALCSILGCEHQNKHSTDISRHKWDHLPHYMLPSCPSGVITCTIKYKGRADKIRAHMRRCHPNIAFPLDYTWPRLVDICKDFGFTLVEKDNPVTLPVASPSSPPHSLEPSTTPADDPAHHFTPNTTNNKQAQWPLMQHLFAPQTNYVEDVTPQSPQIPPFYFQPQLLTPTLSSSTSSTICRDSPYPELGSPDLFSVPFSSVDGPHAAVQGHFVPQQPLESHSLAKVENWDFSRVVAPPEAAEEYTWALYI